MVYNPKPFTLSVKTNLTDLPSPSSPSTTPEIVSQIEHFMQEPVDLTAWKKAACEMVKTTIKSHQGMLRLRAKKKQDEERDKRDKLAEARHKELM
ncbi:hypothetical protein PCANC_09739 [Puccinia coronata f. sp. avenae]|uniref:Uncharacterized protein n=1 Tax=Puccinia coronata f. sp. avenae TaxID=200324 RepID=A0A2N5V7G1_9BASI|nr:hypothetical protein PCASD_05298 [Puccinia coronata f. sp. avenae]PLW45930.1 hypothetical protein PCANC_09739 [Puccinia coronata f. sp. avenae]